MKAILPRSVLALSQLSANGSGSVRFANHNVLLTAKDGAHRCEATDGHYLGILHGRAEGEIDCLIDSKKFAEIKKVLSKDDEKISVEVEGESFSAGAVGSTSRVGGNSGYRGDGLRWPNTNQVIPKGKVAATFRVDARLLIDLLRVAMEVHPGDCCPVLFTVFKDAGAHHPPVAMSCKNEDGTQIFDSVLVPLVESK